MNSHSSNETLLEMFKQRKKCICLFAVLLVISLSFAFVINQQKNEYKKRLSEIHASNYLHMILYLDDLEDIYKIWLDEGEIDLSDLFWVEYSSFEFSRELDGMILDYNKLNKVTVESEYLENFIADNSYFIDGILNKLESLEGNKIQLTSLREEQITKLETYHDLVNEINVIIRGHYSSAFEKEVLHTSEILEKDEFWIDERWRKCLSDLNAFLDKEKHSTGVNFAY